MVVAETLVLLAIGLLAGILSTVFDVLICGSASFLSHFALWVLLNALIAVHVDSRTKAIWWAVPFNLGYIEGYFITTVASFESYAKSLMVPLAAIALISPFLNYALWTARKEKNTYGRVLSLLIVAGTLVTSYVINQAIGVYDVVVCVLLALVLLVLPARRLRIERVSKAAASSAAVGKAPAQVAAPKEPSKRRGKRLSLRKRRNDTKAVAASRTKAAAPAADEKPTERQAPQSKGARTTPRPTKRTGGVERKETKRLSLRQRRQNRNQEAREREERRLAAAERRADRRDASANAANAAEPATLGNARKPRRSTRNAEL